VRKLCSALVAFFIQSTTAWTYCVRHVVCCLQANNVVSTNTLKNLQLSSEQINRLSISQITTTLWFAMALVEEAGKLPFDSIQTYADVSAMKVGIWAWV
jgi:formate hydrogenlyase subunit 4